jgi:hypothetical protein
MTSGWVDEQRVEMPPQNTWSTLSFNQLVDVKNLLLDKIYLAQGRPMYLIPLQKALNQLDALIAVKMNERG